MTKRVLNLKEWFAIVLIAAGVLTPRFLVVRPNRIENGTSLSLMTAAGDKKLLVAVLLFVVIALLVASKVFVKRSMPINGRFGAGNEALLKWTRYLVITALIPLLFLQSSAWAKALLVDGTSAARVSIGLSFWLLLLGLIYLFELPKESKSGLLILLGVLLTLYFAYRTGNLSGLSIVREYTNKSSRINDEVIRHMQISLSASVTGLFLALVLAGQAYRYPKRRGFVMGLVNMAQVIPTLTFLGLIMIPLTQLALAFPALKKFGISGIGFFPAYIVLTMYALLPLTTNILAGYNSIDQTIKEAAKGMGMSRSQVHYKVELPLIVPYIFSGFNIALVQTIGNTILAGLVGGGGIGAILFLGLAQSAPDLVLLSALLVVGIAWTLKLLLDHIGTTIERYVRG